MSETRGGETLVIGLGNPLMSDDGLGLAALEMLRRAWSFRPLPQFLDGGTWGVNLLPYVERAERLLVLDAIRGAGSFGDVVELEGSEIPRFLSTKLSPHQVELREVLALAELRDTLPQTIVAIGVPPERVELGTELSAPLKRSLPRLVARAVERLRGWGHEAAPWTGRPAAGAEAGGRCTR